MNGKHIHEIKPIKFGGSPTDPANKIVLTPAQHAQFSRFWQNVLRTVSELLRQVCMERLSALDCNPPASETNIKAAETAFERRFPAEYVEFLRHADGAAGPIGDLRYIDLWRVEELRERNDAYGVPEFAPTLIVFGSDGGDTAYAFDVAQNFSIVETPFIGMGVEQTHVLGESWPEFIHTLTRR